ncbi:MAG: hypothetical protein AAF623_07885 [Planctomycetota bacterium]
MLGSKSIQSIILTILISGVIFTPRTETLAQNNNQKKRLIYLEISAEARGTIGAQQKWMTMLQDVGADRIVSKTLPNGTPTIEESTTSRATLIRVQGFIVGNRLKLPGGSFKIQDKAAIRALVQSLRDDGAKVALAEKKAFGLTSEQLVSLHQKLASPIQFETQQKKIGQLVKQIVGQNKDLNFVYDSVAKAALAGDEVFRDELQGLSTGTSLAAILRPLGLVLEPYREQGKPMEIRIVDSRSSEENWPIGWPPEIAPVRVEPKLFDRIDIEIRGFQMSIAMNAIQKRAKVPFIYDYNLMARDGVELDQVRVTLVQKQVSLMVAVSKLVRQTKPRMFQELRIDENGKGFLWITIP